MFLAAVSTEQYLVMCGRWFPVARKNPTPSVFFNPVGIRTVAYNLILVSPFYRLYTYSRLEYIQFCIKSSHLGPRKSGFKTVDLLKEV